MHAQHQDGELGARRLYLAQDVDSAAAGHTHIEDDEGPILFPDLFERFQRSLRLRKRHFAQGARKQLLQSRSNHGVIVGNKDFGHSLASSEVA